MAHKLANAINAAFNFFVRALSYDNLYTEDSDVDQDEQRFLEELSIVYTTWIY